VSPLRDVSRETIDRIGPFIALLQRWNPRIQLVADASTQALWSRHIADSLQLAPLVPPGTGPIADLGSGAGFPGLFLALETGRPTHLVEADRRKAAFLLEAARALTLPHVTVHASRIEASALPPLALVTARALAPLVDLLPHAHKMLAPDGVALFPKGRRAEEELTLAARTWTMRVERFPSRTDPAATIFRLQGISPLGAHG
jgi:16S rRNA (guanine(527)-N(7))-methyltransferase RsmG